METQTAYQSLTPEQTVIRIMRRLAPERVAALVDFARFLEYRAAEDIGDWPEIENAATDQAGDADQRWEELFARPEAKEVMRQMAREAREDFYAGRTTEIVDTEDGRLAPG
jgi:hypothetical protein